MLIRLPRSLSIWERIGKQLRHAAQWIHLTIRNRGIPPAFIVWPELPSRRSTLYKICRELGWELTNKPRRKVAGVMRFEDVTEKSRALDGWLSQTGCAIWNEQCTDIRKQTLELHHHSAFGYGMAIDPASHRGPLVEKSDENAKHDGHILDGPMDQAAIDSSNVYQRVIRNQDEAGRWLDLRLVWIRRETPLVYLKFKNESERFTNLTHSVSIADTGACFSNEELMRVNELMRLHGVDSAELDILRDADSGQIFVVDINPTPWGPPSHLDRESSQKAIQMCAQVFRKAWEESKRQPPQL